MRVLLIADTAGWVEPSLAFVAAVLGGGLVAALVSSLHERRENLRTRQVEAAQALLESFDQGVEILDDLRTIADGVRAREQLSSPEEFEEYLTREYADEPET